MDIIAVLIGQKDFQAARNYWKVLKNHLNKEGSETVTKCNHLKLVAENGKMRKTDVVDVEALQRTDYDESIILERALSYIINNKNNI